MRWSWKVAQFAGIGIFVHVTFVILLAWVGLSHFLQRHNWQDAISGLAFIVTLFGVVVLHELGHALTARRFGIRTRDITLLPIGGVGTLERMPEKPWQEILVALAGPAVNFALAAGFFVLAVILSEAVGPDDAVLVGGRILAKLVWVNLALGVFNLLPTFPMDGGRVLRAALAMVTDDMPATQLAATIGQALALVFGFLGLFANPFLVFVAL